MRTIINEQFQQTHSGTKLKRKKILIFSDLVCRGFGAHPSHNTGQKQVKIDVTANIFVTQLLQIKTS